ncbi:hypothetical protein [Dactylosporangium sp. CA-139066]|uniref:hypothetical protein n=1 Tax=Dactylosporangium sp. CA-139066 TaxID=3239930 RepID=UPI003D90BCB1
MRFDGWIAGVGTAEGTRIVLGHWPRSPYGAVSDVMVERADGHRVLLAATQELAEFVAATYAFDEVRVVPVGVRRDGPRWTVEAGPLRLGFVVGRRGALGWLLRAVPAPLAGRPAWVRLIDRPARRLMPGVRTYGSAGGGRREFYGARDLHPIVAAEAQWEGAALGAQRDVEPPVRFGFGSAPRRPALVRITTTVEG